MSKSKKSTKHPKQALENSKSKCTIVELLKFSICAVRQQTEASVLLTSLDSVDRIEVVSSSGCSAIRPFLAKFLHWFETRSSTASLSHTAAAQPGTKVTMATGDPAVACPFSTECSAFHHKRRPSYGLQTPNKSPPPPKSLSIVLLGFARKVGGALLKNEKSG